MLDFLIQTDNLVIANQLKILLANKLQGLHGGVVGKFACSPHVCVGSLQVLQLAPFKNMMHVGLIGD